MYVCFYKCLNTLVLTVCVKITFVLPSNTARPFIAPTSYTRFTCYVGSFDLRSFVSDSAIIAEQSSSFYLIIFIILRQTTVYDAVTLNDLDTLLG